ncbi:MAG TPA: hypothetical protein VNO81_12135 [Candidatus Nitrosotenuis sp.]|nr:hypothetical protein [Candidatus Nitrosotenuis sp.]
MKAWRNRLLPALVVVCLTVGLATWPGSTRSAAAPQAAVGVHELLRHPERYPGTVLVEGVVSAVSPGQKLLALIDTAEYEDCGTTTCAPLQLPVRWTGAMPAPGERVRVRGAVGRQQGKRVFLAWELRRLPAYGGTP